ncbi:Reverse transcriptase domain-containing protein [Vreelandella rituensis]|uniref:Reverse transcriptase domain-containing protein n=1 Tax=Vreelandella rituensis TaxID=2282306 RepID=A0A368TMC1_9GAMM|nr:hypothetical protein DU506_21070 [Halomonas rituensis]
MSDDMNGLRRIEKLRQLNTANGEWVNRDVYRLLLKEDVLIAAYETIKSKAGNMTPGSNGKTLDGTSLASLRRTIERLKDESFQFSPSRRVDIPKRNGKTRPLGIAPPNEKIVQKAIEMILTAIYEPSFSESSHGFRPERGCHTALKQVMTWSNVKWIVEGDIKGFFDAISHKKLIDILRKKIIDERFINLIWKSLRAGYVTFDGSISGANKKGTFHNSLKGTPQGSIVTPLTILHN